MSATIAVVAAGGMGAAVGARLAARGARVITSLAGRSAASAERARAANMQPVSDEELATADIFLSIIPPNQAVALATRVAARFQAGKRPVYVDLNAISPQTAAKVAAVVTAGGASFVDGGIIGGPPRDNYAGPVFYLSGPTADCAEALKRHGLLVKALEGGVGRASALKMAYAGISKGTIALGTCMVLAAERAGVGDALRAELGASQAEMLARLRKAVPAMFPKAYRWVPEMHEIEEFIGNDRPESQILHGMFELYAQIAGDLDGDRALVAMLTKFCGSAA
jgi:putative dehydrogenase